MAVALHRTTESSTTVHQSPYGHRHAEPHITKKLLKGMRDWETILSESKCASIGRYAEQAAQAHKLKLLFRRRHKKRSPAGVVRDGPRLRLGTVDSAGKDPGWARHSANACTPRARWHTATPLARPDAATRRRCRLGGARSTRRPAVVRHCTPDSDCLAYGLINVTRRISSDDDMNETSSLLY